MTISTRDKSSRVCTSSCLRQVISCFAASDLRRKQRVFQTKRLKATSVTQCDHSDQPLPWLKQSISPAGYLQAVRSWTFQWMSVGASTVVQCTPTVHSVQNHENGKVSYRTLSVPFFCALGGVASRKDSTNCSWSRFPAQASHGPCIPWEAVHGSRAQVSQDGPEGPTNRRVEGPCLIEENAAFQ